MPRSTFLPLALAVIGTACTWQPPVAPGAVAAAPAVSASPAIDPSTPPPPFAVVPLRAGDFPAFYTKGTLVGPFAVLASPATHDEAVLEAAFLIDRMIGHRPDLLAAIAQSRVHFAVMARTEMTTDIPEHSDLTPKAYWDRRARGLGATTARPAVSCGEENLLDLPGDPYRTENILIHEFAHTIHQQGLASVDPSFDARLYVAYQHARAGGLWAGTYAMENHHEYWAEGAQSWFDTNRVNDDVHGPIDTRDKLRPYDPMLAALLTEIFGDGPWRYRKPGERPASERAHLATLDRSTAGGFTWPSSPTEPARKALGWLAPAHAPTRSPAGAAWATSVRFINRRSSPVSIEWLTDTGQRQRYVELGPGQAHLQPTYEGHVWLLVERGVVLGAAVAEQAAGEVTIR